MPIKNLTLGAVALLASAALAQNHHNTHKVRKGETLDKIAKWTSTTKNQLVAANHLNGKKLKTGMTLRIPSSQADSGGFAPYTVRKNENDWTIAKTFHMTTKAFHAANANVSWTHLKPGTKLRIPMQFAMVSKLARIPMIRSKFAVVAKSDTLVRSAPGANARRVAKADRGRQVRILARDAHWYKVRFDGGTEGWVRGDLLASVQPRVASNRHVAQKKPTYVAYRTTKAPKGRTSRSGGFYAPLPSAGGDMLAFAESYKNTPYRYGAASRSGTDCSGFALQVLRHEGIKMPRTAAEQSRKGQAVSRGSLKAGDLVFFHTSRGSRISHVGIYMGEGKFIHASSGGGKVQVNSLSDGYYNRRFATARRVAKVKHDSKSERLAEAKREDDAAMRAAEKSMSRGTDKVGD